MRKVLFVLFALGIACFLFSCQSQVENFDTDEELLKIENILDQYVVANENQDFSIIQKIWAEKEDIELIGTDSDEKLIGWNEIKKAIKHQFESFEDIYISVNEQIIHINETGNTAWFSEILSYNFMYKGEAKSYEGVRFTGVLSKNDRRWEIVQGHLSIPAEVDIEK